MELPNLQIGKTQDRVAAGNTVQITTASGGVITARAITPIRSGVVAFQKIEGQGWVAFDPSSPAIASSSKEIRRKRPKRRRFISTARQYFFKGLVRFLDKQLYKGGDNNITGIDENIDAPGILGFANLGGDSLDFIAVYRRQNDLIIELQGVKDSVIGWFLKDYSTSNQWLGADFYGVNQLVIERYWDSARYEIPNGYPFPFDGANAWGYDYTVEPFTGDIEPLPIPEFTATEDGIVTQNQLGETVYPLQGVSTAGPERIAGEWTYKDWRKITKSMNKDLVEESVIVSTNFGQLVQGTRKRTENMSIVFDINFLEQYTEDVWVIDKNQDKNYTYIVWSLFLRFINFTRYRLIGGARDYQFNRSVVGSRYGNTLDESVWTVYLSRDDTTTCRTSRSIDYGGSLNIRNLFTSDVIDNNSRLEKDSLGRILSAYIFPKGNFSGQFEQTASTSETENWEGSITKLMLSGSDCYMFSELNYTSVVTTSANHRNDTDKIIKREYKPNNQVIIGNTYQFHENVEDDYWWMDFRRFEAPILGHETTWFLSNLVQEVNQSHALLNALDSRYSPIDKVKVKNNRDGITIEIDTDSLTFVIDTSEELVVGRSFTLPCSAYVGLDYKISPYEFALEYTIDYSAVGTFRNSQLVEQMTVERSSDDTLHNQMFDSILTREYDVIWKDNETYYIGQATIVSYECKDLPYISSVDTSVSGIELLYQRGRYKRITSITLRLNTRQKINASLLEAYNAAMEISMALVVSRDNYYNYIIATEIADRGSSANLFLRENPIIATASIPSNDEIGSDRIMYAEILELLPDGRWIRREEESGDVTAMNLGTPDGATDLWSYYKK